MKFNPEDGQLTAPRCRNCHKGSSSCGACHNTDHAFPVLGNNWGPTGSTSAFKTGLITDNNRQAITFLFGAMFNMAGAVDPGYLAMFPNGTLPGYDALRASGAINAENDWATGNGATEEPDSVMNYAPITAYEMTHTSNGLLNEVQNANTTTDALGKTITKQIKNSRTVAWSNDLRVNPGTVGNGINNTCSDDGVSFPHRTLGWKMLKDDLFGIDPGAPLVNGQTPFVKAGEVRQGVYGIAGGLNAKAHDVDSVCLDCHNPTVWNATSAYNHTDTTGTAADNANDDLLMRGLP